MNKRKIYVIGGSQDYACWMQGDIVDSMDKASLVVGVGGADWHWSWYYKGKRPHPSLSCDYELDVWEKEQFLKAIESGRKIVGICRSSQGICGALAGGEIVQHQSNESFIHPMKTYDGREIYVSSTHHNSQFPFRRLKEGIDYKLLGWTNNILKYRYLDANEQADKDLPEAEDVFYPKVNALGIQGHPEMIYNSKYKETIEYYQDLLDKFMQDKL